MQNLYKSSNSSNCIKAVIQRLWFEKTISETNKQTFSPVRQQNRKVGSLSLPAKKEDVVKPTPLNNVFQLQQGVSKNSDFTTLKEDSESCLQNLDDIEVVEIPITQISLKTSKFAAQIIPSFAKSSIRPTPVKM